MKTFSFALWIVPVLALRSLGQDPISESITASGLGVEIVDVAQLPSSRGPGDHGFQGFTTFAFHPDFARPDSPRFGKLYTATDETPFGIDELDGNYWFGDLNNGRIFLSASNQLGLDGPIATNQIDSDANLDGLFNTDDFVTVFSQGYFHTDELGDANWMNGDWNGDLKFDTADFVFAIQDAYTNEALDSITNAPRPRT